MNAPTYIPDGYTLHATIHEVERLHGSLTFSYRPLLHHERSLVNRRIMKADDGAVSEVVAKTVAARIASWDLQDASGNDLPVTQEAVAHLQPDLLERVYGVVSGNIAPDELDEQHRRAQADAEFEALVSGKTASEEKEAADVKN